MGYKLYLDTFINEPLICIKKKTSSSARQPAVVINLIIALEEKTHTNTSWLISTGKSDKDHTLAGASC